MAVPLNISPEFGRMVRTARGARGWTIDDLSVELGRFGEGRGYVLGRTQLNRIEGGERNVSAEEAWRFVELFDELPAWDLLAAGRAVDPEATEEFRQATLVEAERRRVTYRESGGNRRRSERWATRQLVAASRAASREGASAAASPFTTDLPEQTKAYFYVRADRPAA